MRRLVFIAVLLTSLTAASPALGKEVLSVRACGTDGCETTKTAGFLGQMTDVGPPTDAPANPAAFYRLSITVGDGDDVAGHDRVSYVPSAGVLLANDGTWLAVRPEIRSGLDNLTRGLDPHPARRLAGFPAGTADAAPPAQAPASTGDDSPIWWILVTAAAALLIGGLLVRAIRIARPSGALHTPD